MDPSTAQRTLADDASSRAEKLAAASALKGTKDGRALLALAKAMELSDEALRDAAKEALRASGGAAHFVRTLQSSKDPAARREAARALRHLKDDASISALASALSDSDVELRREAAHALAVFGADGAVQPLVAALEDASSDVRYFAVLALGEVKDPLARAALQKRRGVEKNATVSGELDRVLGMK